MWVLGGGHLLPPIYSLEKLSPKPENATNNYHNCPDSYGYPTTYLECPKLRASWPVF